MPSAISVIFAQRLAEADGLDARDQGHDPALALVVGAHDERDVLDGHDQRDRPEDERDDAVDAGAVGRHRLGESRLERVERARADVAEDDAERARGEHERPAGLVGARLAHAGLRRRLRVVRRFGAGAAPGRTPAHPRVIPAQPASGRLGRGGRGGRGGCAGAASGPGAPPDRCSPALSSRSRSSRLLLGRRIPLGRVGEVLEARRGRRASGTATSCGTGRRRTASARPPRSGRARAASRRPSRRSRRGCA